MNQTIWIGWDPREASAFAVARASANRHLTQQIPIRGLILEKLQAAGLYRRALEYRKSAADRPLMWDTISDAPMSTQHASARFLIKELTQHGWALFCDGDVLFRGNVARMFRELDPQYAIYCVKHNYQAKAGTKMDGQVQTQYARKNWSSVFVINCQHDANRKLTVDLINAVPGRDLHRFCWLDDDNLIGALPPEWNYLVGESPKLADVKLAHFTLGVPDMPGYENCEFADEWRQELNRWAA